VAVKKRVFASATERLNFYKLSRQWGDKYRLYHNLPFLNIFEVSTARPLLDLSDYAIELFYITDLELNRLKKTSVDYTLCTQDDEPLICLEFDGLQDGFNVGTTYKTNLEFPDPWRDEILTLKLKVAHGNLFPFFVVGNEHFKELSADVRLTIVDGIIGAVLAARAMKERIDGGFDPEQIGWSAEEFEKLDPDSQHEVIQDWVIDVEVEVDMEHNPILRKVAELTDKTGFVSYGSRFLDPSSVKAARNMSERVRLLDAAAVQGAECTLYTKEFGEIKRTVWLPNFKAPYFTGLSLADEIAHLLALDAYARFLRKKGK
jgi:hypothetical protein